MTRGCRKARTRSTCGPPALRRSGAADRRAATSTITRSTSASIRADGRDPLGSSRRAPTRTSPTAPDTCRRALDLFARAGCSSSGGLRYDAFRFDVRDRVDPSSPGAQPAGRVAAQGAASRSRRRDRVPLTLSCQLRPRDLELRTRAAWSSSRDGDRSVATTDFYQAGAVAPLRTRSRSPPTLFLIDRSNELVYIPDDGSFEFAGPSRAYGFESEGVGRRSRARSR